MLGTRLAFLQLTHCPLLCSPLLPFSLYCPVKLGVPTMTLHPPFLALLYTCPCGVAPVPCPPAAPLLACPLRPCSSVLLYSCSATAVSLCSFCSTLLLYHCSAAAAFVCPIDLLAIQILINCSTCSDLSHATGAAGLQLPWTFDTAVLLLAVTAALVTAIELFRRKVYRHHPPRRQVHYASNTGPGVRRGPSRYL